MCDQNTCGMPVPISPSAALGAVVDCTKLFTNSLAGHEIRLRPIRWTEAPGAGGGAEGGLGILRGKYSVESLPIIQKSSRGSRL